MQDFEKPVSENEQGPAGFPSREEIINFIIGSCITPGTEYTITRDEKDEQGPKRFEIETAEGVSIEYQRNEAGKCTIDVMVTGDDEIPSGGHFATYDLENKTWKKVVWKEV